MPRGIHVPRRHGHTEQLTQEAIREIFSTLSPDGKILFRRLLASQSGQLDPNEMVDQDLEAISTHFKPEKRYSK